MGHIWHTPVSIKVKTGRVALPWYMTLAPARAGAGAATEIAAIVALRPAAKHKDLFYKIK